MPRAAIQTLIGELDSSLPISPYLSQRMVEVPISASSQLMNLCFRWQ